MARKKKRTEEHENLERWLVSYADFITLLFATFVVLYALSQIDLAKFKDMQVSMRKAFSSPSVIQGSNSILDSAGSSILSGMDNESNMIPPMFENPEAKMEESNFSETKKILNDTDDMSGVDIKVSERGLVISVADSVFFTSGSAEIKKSAFKTMYKIGYMLCSKFSDHPIRVEGHTDNIPIKSALYPSNWELSSARASSVVRFLLGSFKFNANRFAAIGYADVRPIADNATEKGRSKNRRVEIVVLRNKLARSESTIAGMNRERIDKIKEYEKIQKNELKQYQDISSAARNLMKKTGESVQDIIMFYDKYDKDSDKLAKELKAKEDLKKKELNLPDISLKKPVYMTNEQKKQIDNARKKGIINEAVAELMKQRGYNKDVLIIQQDNK